MPTRFYLNNIYTTPPVQVPYSGGWNSASAQRRGFGDPGIMHPTPSGQQGVSFSESLNTAANHLFVQFVSAPMLAGQTLTGTIAAQALCYESSISADARSQLRAFVVSLDGQTVRHVLREIDAVALVREFGTTSQNRSFPVNTAGVGEAMLGAYVTVAGDRLVVEFGARMHNTTTASMVAGMWLTGTGLFALPADEVTTFFVNQPWVEFSNDITFLPESTPLALDAEPERQVISISSYSVVAVTEQNLGTVVGGSPSDIVPPQVTWTTPAGAVTYDTPIVVSASDDSSLANVLIKATYADGQVDVIYDGIGSTLSADYTTNSSAVPAGGVTSVAFSLRHNHAWRSAFTLSVAARDGGGNVVTSTRAFTLSTASDPAIQNVDPPDLSTIDPTDVLTFDVVVPRGVRRVIVGVAFPTTNNPPEIAHDGDAFQPGYVASTRTAITDGYRYTLRRSGYWYARPKPTIFAFDLVGKEL